MGEEFGVTDGQSITMANGEDITFNFISDVVFINEKSAVEVKDDTATNGVIYGIDTVLVPPGLDVPGFLETCQATDPPVPAPTTPLTLAPQPEPTPARTPSPTTKSTKKRRRSKSMHASTKTITKYVNMKQKIYTIWRHSIQEYYNNNNDYNINLYIYI